MVEDRCVYAARRFTSIQSLNPVSNRVTFMAIVPEAYPGGSKMW